MKKFFVLILLSAICFMVLSCEQSSEIEESKETVSQHSDNSFTTVPGQDSSYAGVTSDGLWAYEIYNGTAKITSALTEDSSVNIPNEIDGYPVTIIGSGAFYQRHKYDSVILPDTLITIESGAFYRCNAILELRIPASVTYIAADAFFRMDNLQAIYVTKGNQDYCDVDGVLYSSDMTELVTFPEGKTAEEYRIPDGVTTIRGCSFGYHPGVKRLIIPSSVTVFPEEPFAAILDSITVVSYGNSAAEDYALRWSIPFEVID